VLTRLRVSQGQKGHRDGDRWIAAPKQSRSGRAHRVYLTASAFDRLMAPFETSPTSVQAQFRRPLDSLGNLTPVEYRVARNMADSLTNAWS
jgi:hypothetical protein